MQESSSTKDPPRQEKIPKIDRIIHVMNVYERVKEISAVLFYLNECYELFLDVGDTEKADLLLKQIESLGSIVIDMCLDHFIRTGEIIPRFSFTDIDENDDMIVTLNSLSKSVKLRLVAPQTSNALKGLARELIRIERIKKAPSEVINVSQTLAALT